MSATTVRHKPTAACQHNHVEEGIGFNTATNRAINQQAYLN
jgi:hypothetical protein